MGPLVSLPTAPNTPHGRWIRYEINKLTLPWFLLRDGAASHTGQPLSGRLV